MRQAGDHVSHVVMGARLNQYIERQRQFGARVGCEAYAREADKRLTSGPIKGGQRAAPVVVPEGPAAAGGVRSSVVDPGIPLGPGLLATRVVFHGPHVRIATASMTTATTANVRKCMRLSALVSNPDSSFLGEQRQDTIDDVDSNDM